MTPNLRPYQKELVREVYRKIAQGRRRLAIVAGTGAGKTVIAAQICAHTHSRGMRMLFLVHLDVLVDQTYEKMQAFGLECGFIKSGWQENPQATIQIASVQTMLKRNWWQNWPADVILYDEAHTTLFSQVAETLMDATHPHSIHLALTATPWRLGKEQMGDRLEDLVASPSTAELQSMGFLAPMLYYGLPKDGQIDLSGVRQVGGNFLERDLKNACDRPELVQRIVEEWERLTPERKTIAFCVDVEHAERIAAAFRRRGFRAAAVSGETPKGQRRDLYDALGEGDLQILTSCNVISIGFDKPNVEVGLLLRPTQSVALHYQQVGRVMRTHPGKAYGIILDQAGNLMRLGFPEDVKEYTLPTAADAEEGQPPPKKQCPYCNQIVLSFTMRCNCGYEWPVQPRSLNLGSLAEIQRCDHDYRPEYCEIRREVYNRGFPPEVAAQVFVKRYGIAPHSDWGVGAIFPAARPEDREAYRNYLTRVARSRGKSPAWIESEMAKEFGG